MGLGLTHYHTRGLIVPFLCAISPLWITKHAIDGLAAPINALVFGAIVGILAYLAFRFVTREDHTLAKAVLCGLLVAEVLVMETAWEKSTIPPVAAIALWLFFYYHTVEHAP